MMDKEDKLENLIVVGDRVLVKPKTERQKTKSGLYLPPGYKEKEELRSGFVVKVGPGYPIPLPTENQDEPWKTREENIKYVPLQARIGDLAIFMQKSAIEVVFNAEKYFIVPQHSILLLERDEQLFD